MRLFIEPTDVWLFRDGRPFDAGSDHRAASLFPPPPSVIQGALRAAHVTFRGGKMDDYVARRLLEIEQEIGSPDAGKPDNPLPFRLRGPFIMRRVQEENGLVRYVRYLPLPADAARVAGGYRTLAPADRTDVRTNLPSGLRLLWQFNRDPVNNQTPEQEEKNHAWATAEAVSRYLVDQQAIPASDAVAESDLFERESRFGIGLDYDVRRPAEGALYEAELIRARHGVGIEIQVDKLTGWPSTGLIKLGGEGHAGRFEVLADEQPDPLQLTPKFKLYFTTPAYFGDGWKPQDWGTFFEPTPQLVAAALPRFESRGGFDLAYQEHKPAKRYVPAGSVYYFEGNASARLKSSNVTEYGAEIGFGQVIIGRW